MNDVMLNINKLSVQDELLNITSPTSSMTGSKNANATNSVDSLMQPGKLGGDKSPNHFDKLYQEQVSAKEPTKHQDNIKDNNVNKNNKNSDEANQDSKNDNTKVNNDGTKVNKVKKTNSQSNSDKSVDKVDTAASNQQDHNQDKENQVTASESNMISTLQFFQQPQIQNGSAVEANQNTDMLEEGDTGGNSELSNMSNLMSQAINMVLNNKNGKSTDTQGNSLPQFLQSFDDANHGNANLPSLNAGTHTLVDALKDPLSQLSTAGLLTQFGAPVANLSQNKNAAVSDANSASQAIDAMNLSDTLSNNALLMQTQNTNAIGSGHKSDANSLQMLMQSTHVDVPVSDSKFADAVFDKVMWLSSNNHTSAEIHLNPADLGPLKVHVKVDEHGGTTVNFVTQQNEVKDALEANASRLRAMMNDSGLNLANLNIANGNAGNQQPNQQEEQANSGKSPFSNPHSEVTNVTAVNSQGNLGSLSALDLYV